jgi:hypothetical protein
LIIRDYPGDGSGSGSDDSDDDEGDDEEGGGGWKRRKRHRESFFDDFLEAEFRKRRKVCRAFCLVFSQVGILLTIIDYSYIKRPQKRYQVSENSLVCIMPVIIFSITCRPRLQTKGSRQLLSHSKPLTEGERALPHQAHHCF